MELAIRTKYALGGSVYTVKTEEPESTTQNTLANFCDMAYSNDGSRLVMGWDRFIIIENRLSGSTNTFDLDVPPCIISITFSKDDSTIIVGFNNRILLLDSETVEVIRTITFDIRGLAPFFVHLMSSNDRIIFGGRTLVGVHNMNDEATTAIIDDTRSIILDMRVSNDESRIAIITLKYVLTVFDLNGTRLFEHQKTCSIAFLRDDSLLITVSPPGEIRLLDSRTYTLLMTYILNIRNVSWMEITNDGSVVACNRNSEFIIGDLNTETFEKFRVNFNGGRNSESVVSFRVRPEMSILM
jgi:WD40 repeat protein